MGLILPYKYDKFLPTYYITICKFLNGLKDLIWRFNMCKKGPRNFARDVHNIHKYSAGIETCAYMYRIYLIINILSWIIHLYVMSRWHGIFVFFYQIVPSDLIKASQATMTEITMIRRRNMIIFAEATFLGTMANTRNNAKGHINW